MNKRQRKKARKKKGPAIMAYYWRGDNTYVIKIEHSNPIEPWPLTSEATDWYLLSDG